VSSPCVAGGEGIRQREIVPPAKLAACHAIVIGVGAIGRQVALQLAAVGIGAMDLIDFDTVDVATFPTNGGRGDESAFGPAKESAIMAKHYSVQFQDEACKRN
jgi:tRNA A37 threonylcarbamoyladenosine dehydratase